MKKQLICAALALVSHAALADSGSTYKVDVELRKEGGEVIGQYSKVVSDGETARYENIKFHDVTKTVTIGPDGKAVETFKPLKVGFTFNGTPIRHQGGAVRGVATFATTAVVDARRCAAAANETTLLTGSATCSRAWVCDSVLRIS